MLTARSGKRRRRCIGIFFHAWGRTQARSARRPMHTDFTDVCFFRQTAGGYTGPGGRSRVKGPRALLHRMHPQAVRPSTKERSATCRWHGGPAIAPSPATCCMSRRGAGPARLRKGVRARLSPFLKNLWHGILIGAVNKRRWGGQRKRCPGHCRNACQQKHLL